MNHVNSLDLQQCKFSRSPLVFLVTYQIKLSKHAKACLDHLLLTMKLCVKYLPFSLDFEYYNNCLVTNQLAHRVSYLEL